MSEYYLMAQLPSLDGLGDATPLPITEERFAELCHRFLGAKARRVLDTVTLIPPREGISTGNPLVDAFCEDERALRLALAKVRAEKRHQPPDSDTAALPLQALHAARAAAEMDSPMDAELYLNRYRLETLDTHRPSDPFAEDAVFHYALKLRLLTRIRRFDTARGEAAYRRIYDAIIPKEAIQ